MMAYNMVKHFVTFLSPGTLFSESNTLPIEMWDVRLAIKMADDIHQRYDATPYGFYFTTRVRELEDFDSRESKRSRMCYLGGVILTLADIKARNDDKDHILISNMEGNGYGRVIQNDNSWRVTQPFMDGDVVLEYIPPHKRVKEE
jgi:hypothetical protein